MPTLGFETELSLLGDAHYRVAMVESELRLALAAAQKAEAAHAVEVAKVEADVKHVLAERRTLLQKLQTIEVVEDSMRELYVQMKVGAGRETMMVQRLLRKL